VPTAGATPPSGVPASPPAKTRPASAAELSLASKRQLARMQGSIMPDHAERLRSMCGVDIATEVDWASIGNSEQAWMNLEHQALERIREGFESSCSDKVGKDTVAQKIKKIVVRNIADGSKKTIAIAKGVMTVEAAWGGDGDGYFGSGDYRDALTKAL
jgi:hypothetical protein